MWFIKSFVISCFLIVVGCGSSERGDDELYIGTISGPESTLVEVASQIALSSGLKVKIIEFEDYITPNSALAEGAIDANMFQHLPYLEIFNSHRHYEIESIGETFVYPMGIYSKKHAELSKLPTGATVGIPNDPSNGARALRLLAQTKLISIQDKDDFSLRPKDIKLNPKQLVIKELDAAQLPRVLDDLDLAIINTNYAIPAGLYPKKNALFIEDKDSPYANIVVIRSKDKAHPKYKTLMDALQSDQVLEKANELFDGQAIPAWIN